MAKQTFTTGQVLTAAQMTSLQQTAMLGGAASAKTASYTLVAADAGTAITMSNASATTITVNTALFAAGDTVQITNLGAGVCTITAGTATVNTSASLALAQYESGTLNFTSTSAAIFIKGAGAAASSGGMTLLSTTTLSGASVTISGISQSYKSLVGYIRLPLPSTDGAALRLRPNNVSTTSYFNQFEGTGFTATAADATEVRYAPNTDNATTNGFITFEIFDYADTTHYKMISALAQTTDQSTPATQINGRNTVAYLYSTSAITSLVVFFDSGNMTSGTLLLYGVS